jgi:hypothetical protein
MSQYGQDKWKFVRRQIINLFTNTVWSNKLQTCRECRSYNSHAITSRLWKYINWANLCPDLAVTVLKVSLRSQDSYLLWLPWQDVSLPQAHARFCHICVVVCVRSGTICSHLSECRASHSEVQVCLFRSYGKVCLLVTYRDIKITCIFNHIQHKIRRGSWGVIFSVSKDTGTDRDGRGSIPSVTNILLASLWGEGKRRNK